MTRRQHNAADATQVRKREREEKDRRERDARDLAALLRLPEFRRYVLRHMCGGGGMFQTAFSTNGSTMAHLIGRQDFARELWAEIESVDPAAIPLMLTEQLAERRGPESPPPTEEAE